MKIQYGDGDGNVGEVARVRLLIEGMQVEECAELECRRPPGKQSKQAGRRQAGMAASAARWSRPVNECEVR